jgi:ubiquinone/menaquinone biosynthesis C-methylase UbiE
MVLSKIAGQQLGRPGLLFSSSLALLWNRRNADLNETVLQLLPDPPPGKIMEVGFGGGYLISRMFGKYPEVQIVGVDHSRYLVRRLQKHLKKQQKSGRLVLKCAPAEDLPFPDGSFQGICSVNSIFYWDDIPAAVSELRRVLEAGGWLCLCFTLPESIEDKSFACEIHPVKPDEIRDLLVENGFNNPVIHHFRDRHRKYVCITAEWK